MFVSYPACFYKEGNSYSVVFPDLNHLATQGETVDEAIKKATEALAFYLYDPIEGQIINPPSKLEDISLEDIYEDVYDAVKEGSFKSYVSVDVKDYAKKHFEKAVKKTLTIPSWLNELALEKGINFFQVLQEALKAKLNI